ncbi:MAG TPA: extensin family protein, partial [Polyangium sp.]|nr:extensin family protein [Polyangium sp.]
LTVPDPTLVQTTAAYRYANMTNDEAIAELNRRGLPYITVDPEPGVRAPIRLTGRLHGVLIHSGLAPSQRDSSPFEILDARLALALDDFTAILEKHDIDEIEHFSMYRPNKPAATTSARTQSPPVAPAKPVVIPAKPAPGKPANHKLATRGKPKPAAKPAAPAKPPVTKKPLPKTTQASLGKSGLGAKTSELKGEKGTKQKGAGDMEEMVPTEKEVVLVRAPAATNTPVLAAQSSGANPIVTPGETRHPGALAIDVGKLRKKDGTWILVAAHFHGKIGERACGPDAPVPESAEARELRALVCEAMDKHIFTYVLTPNYNVAHADHFHMEIKPGVKWFMVH